MMVVQGCYTLIIGGQRIPIRAGEEYFIPKGLWHGGEPLAGTRTIHPSAVDALTGSWNHLSQSEIAQSEIDGAKRSGC